MEKIVIHVWTNNCSNFKFNKHNNATYWGFGDILRGTIKLFQLSEIFGFTLFVDISNHPVSQFFEEIPHPFKSLVNTFKDKIPYFPIDTLEESIINFIDSTQKIYILNTNDKPVEDYPISDNCKQFLKKILTPTPELQK